MASLGQVCGYHGVSLEKVAFLWLKTYPGESYSVRDGIVLAVIDRALCHTGTGKLL